MRNFVKMLFASCLGTILALGLIILLFMGIGSALSSGQNKLNTDGVLMLDFKELILEKTGNQEVEFFGAEMQENIGLRDFDLLIQKAKEDNQIDGILIKNPMAAVGQATLMELMESLENFKESGKFIYAYGDMYSQSGYFISSVADSIFLNPLGEIDLKGYSVMYTFFKNGLDKLGVGFDIFYAGDFKSATEPYRRENMSEQNKLQTREFLKEMVDIMSEKASSNRGISLDKFDEILNSRLGRTPDLALENGLIDDISYWSEVEDLLKSKVGKKAKDKLKLTSIIDYKSKRPIINKGPLDKKIAVVYAEGIVNYGTSNKGEINDGDYIKMLSKIRNDERIKAVVLRVNSGGGSALTSDIIWHEIERIKQAGKPVIASFGDYAASGGYYIAAGADTIVSAANTLTGSIGVFSMLPNAKELVSDKIGITFDTVKTHQNAIGYTGVIPLSDYQKDYFEDMTENIYDTFLSRVAQGRKMTKEEVHEVAQGRVWTGQKAQELGLVDVIGDLNKAIEIAANAAGLSDYKISEYPYIKEDIFEKLVKEFAKGMEQEEDASLYSKTFYLHKKLMKEIQQVYMTEGPQARIPFTLITE